MLSSFIFIIFLNTINLSNCQSNSINIKKSINYITIPGKKFTSGLENSSYKVLNQLKEITKYISCSIDDVCIYVQVNKFQRNCLFFKVNSTLLLNLTNTIQDETSIIYIKTSKNKQNNFLVCL